MACICWRDRTVVLTSSFSISEPRAALTVTGGRTTCGCGVGGAPGCGLDGSVWAYAGAGTTANPAKAAKVAARIDNMERSSTDKQSQRPCGRLRLRMSGEERWCAG